MKKNRRRDITLQEKEGKEAKKKRNKSFRFSSLWSKKKMIRKWFIHSRANLLIVQTPGNYLIFFAAAAASEQIWNVLVNPFENIYISQIAKQRAKHNIIISFFISRSLSVSTYHICAVPIILSFIILDALHSYTTKLVFDAVYEMFMRICFEGIYTSSLLVFLFDSKLDSTRKTHIVI